MFNDSALPQDKSDYRLYEVIKVGELQNRNRYTIWERIKIFFGVEVKTCKVKVGDKVLISGQIPQEIKIAGYGKLENTFKLNNSDSIFSIVDA